MIRIARTLAAILLCALGAAPLLARDNAITVALPPDGLSQAERKPLQNYLTIKMGREVRVVTPNSYVDTIDGLANGTIDFACLGGLSYVRAHAKIGVLPLVQRPADQQFHAVFIAFAGTSIHSLGDLRGRKFAYGDVNSTSGHLMPYFELKRAGLNPNTDLDFRYSGGHPLTIKLVESGVVDAGAVDETILNSMISEGKADQNKLRVIHTSKPFVDWVYVARKDIGDSERQKFAGSLLGLHQGKDDEVLKILRANKFIKANDEEYGTLREVARELKMY